MKTKLLLLLSILFLASNVSAMDVLITNLDGTNPQLTQVFFVEEHDYIQYGIDLSGQSPGYLVVVGYNLETPPRAEASWVRGIFISGSIVKHNLPE
jgi:hypothetical protein